MEHDAARPARTPEGDAGHHIACTLTAGILRRIRALGGAGSVAETLRVAGSQRSVEYLEDNGNWVSIQEATDLLRAGVIVSGDQQFARHIGEDAVRQYAGSQVATVLRSLGSPEELLRQIATVASKFSTISTMEPRELSPGRAVVVRRVNPGHAPLDPLVCEWASGLLSAATMLFAMPPARVEEVECQARGGEGCVHVVSWDQSLAERHSNPAEHVTALEAQMVALNERMEGLFAAAGDLIADDELDAVLEQITGRAATAVRAQRYLLALHDREGRGEPEVHHRGYDDPQQVADVARELLAVDLDDAPANWLVVDVRSKGQHHGRLLAQFEGEAGWFPAERQMLEHYARFAATALDGAFALDEARRGHRETRALLDFARSLAGADSSSEVARRLAEAVPRLIDCDRVAVFVRDERTDVLTCTATHGYPPELEDLLHGLDLARDATGSELSDTLVLGVNPRPMFFGPEATQPFVLRMMETFDSRAITYVPIIARGRVLGVLSVSVTSRPERLREHRELVDRLSGVVAQAAVGLENGALLDRVTHQARHDALTGLPNRGWFSQRFASALDEARAEGTPMGLFFVDLNDFKTINDEYGHAAGDELLRHVAARLLATVRSADTVARLGGDEFAIILRDASRASEVEAAASRVMDAFGQPFQVGEHSLCIEASIGRAVWPHDADGIEELMHIADASMYRAKREFHADGGDRSR